MNLQEIVCTQKQYVPKGFYRCKNLNVIGEKQGDEAVDHEMDL